MTLAVPLEGFNLSQNNLVESYHRGGRKRDLVIKGHTQPFNQQLFWT